MKRFTIINPAPELLPRAPTMCAPARFPGYGYNQVSKVNVWSEYQFVNSESANQNNVQLYQIELQNQGNVRQKLDRV
jgi:hypothetical protein